MLRQFACTLVFALFSTSIILAADWPVFHGPKGDNKSTDTGLLKSWPADGPKLLWKADFIGFGYSGVTVANGRIYTAGNDGNRSMVFCIDMNGNKIWESANGPAHAAERTYPGTRGTPTVDGDLVFDVSPLGNVAAFNAQTGNQIWSRNLMTEYNAPQPRWFLGHSTVVEGDHLICMVGSERALAVALNKRTGETVLEFQPTPEHTLSSYATPYLFDFEGTRVLAALSSTTLEIYDVKTARKLVSIPWQNNRTVNAVAPIYRNGHLFLSTGYGYGAEGYRLAKNADGTITATKLWHIEPFDNQHHGIVLVGNHVYGTTHNGNWMAVNFLTGAVGYTARPIGEAASIHYADGLIYALSQDSATVILWEPNPVEFISVGRFILPEADGKAWAHPVVIGGKLYLRHAQYLYCFDVKGP
ncbi:MAG: PQQ-like beta-propeller repeat protein [Planctomycetaceae bacterium]|nr:PQQ-like beta-propeller repeat protein [Planctomycetaceae bacterium]